MVAPAGTTYASNPLSGRKREMVQKVALEMVMVDFGHLPYLSAHTYPKVIMGKMKILVPLEELMIAMDKGLVAQS